MPCDAKLLEGLVLFEHLESEDLEILAAAIDDVRIAIGEALFDAGDPGDSIFIVRSGEIELSIKDNVGQKIVLSIAHTGELFGELALLDQGARSATAIAIEESHLLVLDRDDLLLLFQRSPMSALKLLGGMAHMTRKADELLRTRVSRNVNVEAEEELTVLQRLADWIAWFSGSMPFLMLNGAWFLIWIAINQPQWGFPAFDPYPFGLLTMIVSLEAIFLSCFVLISQNRQAQKERIRADIEYEVNVKAELEVAHLHEKVDRLYEQMLQRLARVERAARGEG